MEESLNMKLLTNESGSFTIEATLVYPVVFLTTIALLFFSLWTYERVALQQMSALAADRAAYNWDNSYKDPITGAFNMNENDGLYWRVGNDRISDIFGSLINDSPITFHFPEVGHTALNSGPERKLQQVTASFPNGIAGRLTYRNHLADREVTVQLSSVKTPLNFLESMLGNNKNLAAESSAHVTEPVEFIRNVQLVIDYIPKLKGIISGKDAQQTLQENIPSPAKTIVIQSEAEASRYIQQLVHGHTVNIATEDNGKSRKIDALDADGIAHEAKYTVNNTEARAEILKDVELIKKGKVKGVVWHFFRITKNGKLDLSPSLRQALEDNGIVIVIHN